MLRAFHNSLQELKRCGKEEVVVKVPDSQIGDSSQRGPNRAVQPTKLEYHTVI